MAHEANACVETLRKAARYGVMDCNQHCPAYNVCPTGTAGWNNECMFETAADLIESLSAELEHVTQERDGLNILLGQAQSMLETRTRERDAAVQDLNACCPCEVCTRSCTYDKVNAYDECADFQWRGPGGTQS